MVMASVPDTHPDSIPAGPSDSPEQVTPPVDPGRESVEGTPGDPGGTAGTGGEITQDEAFER
jgi:hypothetical protein